jgi:hypothetical protein
MDDVVVFDPVEFRALYPSISATDVQLEDYFAMAETFLDNTKCSVVKDLGARKRMLYLLVAHIATLTGMAEKGNPVVGRISSATEGTVSVSLDYGTMGNNERWYLQTPWGAMYWQLTKRYRSAVYRLGIAPMPVQRTFTQ